MKISAKYFQNQIIIKHKLINLLIMPNIDKQSLHRSYLLRKIFTLTFITMKEQDEIMPVAIHAYIYGMKIQ